MEDFDNYYNELDDTKSKSNSSSDDGFLEPIDMKDM